MILDGTSDAERPVPETTIASVRRVALMNRKKVAGTGVADRIGIGIFAWRDREFLREQFRLIAPTVTLTCGPDANRLFGIIAHDDPFWEAPAEEPWGWEGVPVLPVSHPSLRPYQASNARAKVVEMAGRAGAGAYRGRSGGDVTARRGAGAHIQTMHGCGDADKKSSS